MAEEIGKACALKPLPTLHVPRHWQAPFRSFAKMLVIDFRAKMRLGAPMDDDHSQLISKLFALLTSKFEDGASRAFSGQGQGHDPLTISRLANHIHSAGEEIAIIAEAVSALTDRRNSQA